MQVFFTEYIHTYKCVSIIPPLNQDKYLQSDIKRNKLHKDAQAEVVFGSSDSKRPLGEGPTVLH